MIYACTASARGASRSLKESRPISDVFEAKVAALDEVIRRENDAVEAMEKRGQRR
jgi:hypothetical protein